jgi:hypothetical protein
MCKDRKLPRRPVLSKHIVSQDCLCFEVVGNKAIFPPAIRYSVRIV